MNFDTAFALLIDPVREGGYSDGKGDPGGETNHGITIATARRNGYLGEMRDLPLSFAKEIYRREYWTPAGCDVVPDEVKFDLFDLAVNSGPTQAVKLLQRAIGARDDGNLGPLTLQRINSTPAWRVAVRLIAVRLDFQTHLANWPDASRGWARRNAANLLRL